MARNASKAAPNKTRHARVLMVIPTLGDRIDLLERTLQSVAAQGKDSIDTVLVCPARATDARKLAARFGASVVDDPGGLSAAVNSGMAVARPWHEYACWMGDDDLIAPGALDTTVPALDANPKATVAFGYCSYIDDTGKLIFTSRAGSLAPWIMTWGPNLVPLPGMLYRLSALREVGDFNESLKYAMDLDMLLRLKKKGPFINTGIVTGSFRWHPTSTTVANRIASLNETEKVKRQYLPKYLQVIAPLWELPVRWATMIAAKRVNNIAKS